MSRVSARRVRPLGMSSLRVAYDVPRLPSYPCITMDVFEFSFRRMNNVFLGSSVSFLLNCGLDRGCHG